MKRLSLVLAAMLMSSGAAWAFQADVIAPSGGDRPVSFGVQLSGGLLNGKAKEHVFDNDVFPGERYQVSRLDWDLKNVAMAGFNASPSPPSRALGSWAIMPASAWAAWALVPARRGSSRRPAGARGGAGE